MRMWLQFVWDPSDSRTDWLNLCHCRSINCLNMYPQRWISQSHWVQKQALWLIQSVIKIHRNVQCSLASPLLSMYIAPTSLARLLPIQAHIVIVPSPATSSSTLFLYVKNVPLRSLFKFLTLNLCSPGPDRPLLWDKSFWRFIPSMHLIIVAYQTDLRFPTPALI